MSTSSIETTVAEIIAAHRDDPRLTIHTDLEASLEVTLPLKDFDDE